MLTGCDSPLEGCNNEEPKQIIYTDLQHVEISSNRALCLLQLGEYYLMLEHCLDAILNDRAGFIEFSLISNLRKINIEVEQKDSILSRLQANTEKNQQTIEASIILFKDMDYLIDKLENQGLRNYYNGWAKAKSFANVEAIQLFELAAADKVSRAFVKLAIGTYFSKLSEVDRVYQSIEYYQKALVHDPNNHEAMFGLGAEYLAAANRSKLIDDETMFRAKYDVFEEAAKLGNADAIYSLAKYYSTGRFFIKKDQIKSFNLMNLAADLGNADALKYLGLNVCATAKYGEAIKYLSRALAINPYDDTVKRELANIHIIKIGFDSREGLVMGYKLLCEIRESNRREYGSSYPNSSLDFDIERVEDYLELYYGGA